MEHHRRNLSEYFHYGACIAIKFQDQDQGSEDRYIYSDGFQANSFTLTEISFSTNVDSHGAIFRVLPPYQHQHATKIRSKLDTLENLKQTLSSNREEDVAMTEMLEELDMEVKLNIDNFNKNKENIIKFGKSFQLQHIKSKKLLSFQPNLGTRQDSFLM